MYTNTTVVVNLQEDNIVVQDYVCGLPDFFIVIIQLELTVKIKTVIQYISFGIKNYVRGKNWIGCFWSCSSLGVNLLEIYKLSS